MRSQRCGRLSRLPVKVMVLRSIPGRSALFLSLVILSSARHSFELTPDFFDSDGRLRELAKRFNDDEDRDEETLGDDVTCASGSVSADEKVDIDGFSLLSLAERSNFTVTLFEPTENTQMTYSCLDFSSVNL